MYVIAGVSGNTGSVVAAQLLAAKQQIRVIVRDAAKGEAWRAKGAEVAIADLEDQAALTRALTGATGAYLLLPPPNWNQTGIAAERKRKTDVLIGAVKAAKPGHVVLLSSVGAELAAGTGPIQYLHAVEDGLRTTGVPATFLRAGAFMENWGSMAADAIAGGALYYGVTAGLAFPQVATEDIGKLAAKLLLEGGKGGVQVVELAGPVDASVQDVAAALAKVSGKPVNGVSVPPAAMIQALVGHGASQELADAFGEMADGISRGAIKFHGTPVRGTVTLEQRLRGLIAPAS
ncbi:MAG TPA: NmrA family NAD(P)-binding protein [Kofleriaceae bacterium]|nr:NmrA family NAD(P)-binding protein [Kofleriaceae bacterium]